MFGVKRLGFRVKGAVPNLNPLSVWDCCAQAPSAEHQARMQQLFEKPRPKGPRGLYEL